MPRLSSRLNNYTDCERAFQAAASGGSMVLFETRGSAVHWRQRAYKFRTLYRDHTDQIYKGVDGREHLRGTCPYDHWKIDIEERGDKWACVIVPKDQVIVRDLAGNPVDEPQKEEDII